LNSDNASNISSPGFRVGEGTILDVFASLNAFSELVGQTVGVLGSISGIIGALSEKVDALEKVSPARETLAGIIGALTARVDALDNLGGSPLAGLGHASPPLSPLVRSGASTPISPLNTAFSGSRAASSLADVTAPASAETTALLRALRKPLPADVLKIDKVSKFDFTSVENYLAWMSDLRAYAKSNLITSDTNDLSGISTIALKKTLSGAALDYFVKLERQARLSNVDLTCVVAMEKLAIRHQRDTSREQRNPQARYYQLAQGRRKLDVVIAEWHEIILVWLESPKAPRLPSSHV
jgi:hypothetical protein